MKRQKTILTVEQKNGKTVMKNDRGNKWEAIGNIPDKYAIGALVFCTLEKAFEDTKCWSDNFEIELTIKPSE